ncbi:MAG: SMI1/KNR4 family protein [Cyanobacteriota bacterium]|nr:SMI1/KNR4 family protein [Cyanobacteriota bacterium]
MYNWMSKKIGQAKQIASKYDIEWSFVFEPPASLEQINDHELSLDIVFPPSYREFLMLHNGMTLFLSENYSTAIKIYGLSEIKRSENQSIFVFSDDTNREFHSGFHISKEHYESKIVKCYYDYPYEDWPFLVIANSFDQWLKRIFNAVTFWEIDPKYWLTAYQYSGWSQDNILRVSKNRFLEYLSESSQESQIIKDLVCRGNQKRLEKDFHSAIEYFNRAINIDPFNYSYFSSRGYLLFQANQIEKALSDYNYSISNYPMPSDYKYRGVIRHQLGDLWGAAQDFTCAIEHYWTWTSYDLGDPSIIADIYCLRAQVLVKVNRGIGAVEDLKNAAIIYDHCHRSSEYEATIIKIKEIHLDWDEAEIAEVEDWLKHQLQRF